MQNEGTLLLKCVDKDKKLVFKVESVSLVSIYALILADIEEMMNSDLEQNLNLKIKWEYYHYLDDDNNGISARFCFFDNNTDKKIRTGVIWRIPKNENSDFAIFSDNQIYTSYDFLAAAEQINLKLFRLSGGDIDIARTAMLFALRDKTHPLWKAI